MPAALLDVRDLAVTFALPSGSIRAVDGVSFTIAPGETVAVVGESGSGKSAMALAILRLVQPPGRIVSGSVLFGGCDLLALGEREMRRIRGARISLVFQEPTAALNPVFTIGDQVAEAILAHRPAPHRHARGEALDLLRAVGIADAVTVGRAWPHQLSGGLRQRAAIAMALACSPSLLIADEPTTALDVTIQAGILDLLREMKAARGLSLLLITHDLGVVAHMADRVAVMYAGRLVEQAPVAAIFDAPAHPYTQALLAVARGSPRGEPLPVIDGTVPDPARLPPGCAFAPRCPVRVSICEQEPPRAIDRFPGASVQCHLHDGRTG